MALSNPRSKRLFHTLFCYGLVPAVFCLAAVFVRPIAAAPGPSGGPSRLALYSSLMTRLSDKPFTESDHFRTIQHFWRHYRTPDDNDPLNTDLIKEYEQALEQMPKCVGLLNAALQNSGCLKHTLSTEEKAAFAKELSASMKARSGVIREIVRTLSGYSLFLDSRKKKKQGILCLMLCFSLLGDIESLFDFLPEPDSTSLGTDPYFAHVMVISTLAHCYDILAGKVTNNAYSGKILQRLATLPDSVTRRLTPWDSILDGLYRYNSSIIRLMRTLKPMPGGMHFLCRDKETEGLFLHEVKQRPCAIELVTMYMNHAIGEWADIIRRAKEAFIHPYGKRQELLKSVYDDLLAYKYHNLINHIIIPNFQRSDQNVVRCLTMGRFAETACLLELYREQTGTYPDNLESIIEGTVPDDPFTGQPFVYYRFNDEYVLVSGSGDSAVTLTETQVLESLANRHIDAEGDDFIYSSTSGLLKNYGSY